MNTLPKKDDAIIFYVIKLQKKSSKKTGVVKVLCMGGRVDRADGRMFLQSMNVNECIAKSSRPAKKVATQPSFGQDV